MNNSAWYKHIDTIMQLGSTQQHSQLIRDIQEFSGKTSFELPQELLQKAAEYGHTDLIIATLEAFPDLAHTLVINYSITEAARSGSLASLNVLLLKRVMEHPCNMALEEAAARGHVGCVERLIPLSHRLDHDSQALRCAAYYNHLECVKLLLPHSDPYDRNCTILQHACTHDNKDMFEYLYPLHSLSQIKEALEYMSDFVGHEYTVEAVEFLEQRYTASLLDGHLAESIDAKTHGRAKKM